MTRNDGDPSRLADLAISVGVNLQPGQILAVSAEYGQHEFARELAASAYSKGAKFVDVVYFDPLVKRARIAYAPEDSLDFVPPWYGERALELGRQRAAAVTIRGTTVPGALDGLDPERAGRDQLPFLKETMQLINDRSVNWTVVAFPTQPWADLVYPDLRGEAALEQLWKDVVHVSRLDEADPLAAWDRRLETLERVSEAMTEASFDAVHFEGPGTDLTVGLLPSCIWKMARWSTADGIQHMPNLPTEEVFTTPDPERTEGRVRSTKPLVLGDGTLVTGLEVRFERGRAVSITAEQGGEVLAGRAAIDDGASRLGEVALVDRESRIGQLGTVFYETLLDENAASHIALGSGFSWGVSDDADAARVNESAIHIDFMIGGDDVDVTGITRDGARVPILRGGLWQLPSRAAV